MDVRPIEMFERATRENGPCMIGMDSAALESLGQDLGLDYNETLGWVRRFIETHRVPVVMIHSRSHWHVCGPFSWSPAVFEHWLATTGAQEAVHQIQGPIAEIIYYPAQADNQIGETTLWFGQNITHVRVMGHD